MTAQYGFGCELQNSSMRHQCIPVPPPPSKKPQQKHLVSSSEIYARGTRKHKYETDHSIFISLPTFDNFQHTSFTDSTQSIQPLMQLKSRLDSHRSISCKLPLILCPISAQSLSNLSPLPPREKGKVTQINNMINQPSI